MQKEKGEGGPGKWGNGAKWGWCTELAEILGGRHKLFSANKDEDDVEDDADDIKEDLDAQAEGDGEGDEDEEGRETSEDKSTRTWALGVGWKSFNYICSSESESEKGKS